jgi:hypothetical protein
VKVIWQILLADVIPPSLIQEDTEATHVANEERSAFLCSLLSSLRDLR